MNPTRFQSIVERYPRLRIAAVGDFCLDRYLEIDPARAEVSIETGLPVRNVVRVRSQPGGIGTVVNNLVALGIGEIYAVGFAGEDGEGWELRRRLASMPSVRLDYFLQTPDRQTFTYTKPLMIEPGCPPTELNRLDFKNWTPTPPALETRLAEAIRQLAGQVDAMVLLEQVDQANTGVLTDAVLDQVRRLTRENPARLILADSRRGVDRFPPVTFKMNEVELARLARQDQVPDLKAVREQARTLARRLGQRIFVTLAENGIVGADPAGEVMHAPALLVRGPIDIVGAGDAVTANLVAALAAGAALGEAIGLANAAASIVIHQLGTTGTASVRQLGGLVAGVPDVGPG